MSRKRRKFTDEFKQDVVRLIRETGRSIRDVSNELDLTQSAVRRWVEQAEVDRGEGPPGVLTTSEKEELNRLRRENRELRMEKEILKKAAAFFAKESQ